MRRAVGTVLALGLVMWGSVAPGAPVVNAEPAVVDLGTLPGGSESSTVAINDDGVVVGRAKDAQGLSRPVRWDADHRIAELPLPPQARYATVFGVDASGAAFGNTGGPDGWERAVRWNPDGSTTVLDLPPGHTRTRALAVNDGGTVVGHAYTVGQSQVAVRWDASGAATALPGVEGARWTEAQAIDEGGAVAGISTVEHDLSDDLHYVRWDDGALTDLGTVPGNTHASVQGINGRYVIGTHRPVDRSGYALRWDGSERAEVPGGGTNRLAEVDAEGTAFGMVGGRPARWTAGGEVVVQALPEGYGSGQVLALNAHGATAGVAISAQRQPVRWSASGEVTALPFPSPPSPRSAIFASDVNDRGVVVGEAGGRALLWP
ncbi:hypothetical protein [Saccharothrix xinjiangensis]|uniref:HAF family extracellular repeat protein n=1 Tax=Saccharothrix xinjiangensis TaxID=204798 RepID=A0ABV9XSJ2_9PSEU